MNLVGEAGRGHLRRFIHFVALAGDDFLGGVFDLRGAVFHIRAAVVVELRRQQAGDFCGAVAQSGGGLLDGLLERSLHRAMRFFLVPVRGLLQRLVGLVLRFGAALLDFFFDLGGDFAAGLFDFARGRFLFRCAAAPARPG